MTNNSEIIKVMPDYECFPLWKVGVQSVENVSPNDLPISQELKGMIYDWQYKFDTTLDKNDPLNSGFKSDMEMRDFERDGKKIWELLSKELNGRYIVKYYSIVDGNLHELKE